MGNEISLQYSGGQSQYYAQLHYNICTQYLFMHQARLQVADSLHGAYRLEILNACSYPRVWGLYNRKILCLGR